MSTNGHDEQSESLKAARSSPPLPGGRGENRVQDDGLSRAWPLILSIGGAAATAVAGLAAERTVSRHGPDLRRTAGRAGDWLDDATDTARSAATDWTESLVSSGAKAAGIAGLLKAIGSGSISGGTMTAAKAIALKKAAERAIDLAGLAKRHPAVAAAGTAGLLKARSAAETGRQRLEDAYDGLRGRRHEPQDDHSAVATGVALLGIGAAAWYLFDPHQGPQRRRALRESFLGLGRQASDSVRSAATTVKQAAEDVGEQVSAAVEDRRENDPDRRENDPAE